MVPLHEDIQLERERETAKVVVPIKLGLKFIDSRINQDICIQDDHPPELQLNLIRILPGEWISSRNP